MYFKQFYLGCLAHASYLLGSQGVGVVVDPQRDVDEYLNEAAAQNLEIKYIIETHLHADFVSGHNELAARTGAKIVFGAEAQATLPHRAVKNGDTLQVGALTLHFLETPGHTPEGICVLVTDAESPDAPAKLLTGDTLFIGDVGRPDLAGGRGYTTADMAGMMYDSLHTKILPLPDATEIYPAHGAGSMCGRNISKDTWSTLGQQRQFNYALQPMERQTFVEMMTAELPDQPAYFSQDAAINRHGAKSLADLPTPPALTAAEVQAKQGSGVTVLDVRTPAEFGAGHIPNSLHIGLGGQFASWAGSLLDMRGPLILVTADESQLSEAVMRLARVGIESVTGYLAGGMVAWESAGLPVAQVPQIPLDQLNTWLSDGEELQVIDVRRRPEHLNGHVPTARHAPLNTLTKSLSAFDPTRRTAVICAGGYRSSIATSLLEQHGFTDLHNVTGGTDAWVKAGYATEKPASVAA